MRWTSNALVCVVTLLVASDCNAFSKSISYTRVIETRLPNPSTIQLGSSLLTVSRTRAHLYLNDSTFGKWCRMRVNPLEENMQGRLQATSLNDGQRFLVWGIRKMQNTTKYYTLLIVDPNQCRYTTVPLPTETVVFSDWPVFLPQIVVRERDREFSVYYPQGSTCSPCRFDYEGNKKTGNSLTTHRSSKPDSHFWIDVYSGSSSSYDKYFYAFNFANGTSIVHVMDGSYGTEERIQFNHTIDAASVKMDVYRNTAICYKSVNKRRVFCERLDMQLQPGISWELPSLSGNDGIYDVSINVDSIGNTFIGVLTTRRLHFYVYDVAGEQVTYLDFGEVDENYNTHREVKGIPFGNEFCLEAVVYSDASVKNVRHVIKCVDVSKYIEDNAWSGR